MRHTENIRASVWITLCWCI